MPAHKSMTPTLGIHTAARWSFAAPADRDALNTTEFGTVSVTADDVGSIAKLTDTNPPTLWALVGHSPVQWAQIGTTQSPGLPTFEFASSVGVSTSSSATFQTKVTLNTSSLQAGTYRVQASFGWALNATTSDFRAILLEDGVPVSSSLTGDLLRQEPKDSAGGGGGQTGTDQEYRCVGTFYRALAAGAHTYQLQWAPSVGGVAASIWDAAVELWRVA